MPAKIVVQNVYSRIAGLVPDELSEKIKEQLQYKVLNYEHILEAQNNTKFSTSSFDGAVYLYWPAKGHMFYTGMMSDVLRILDEAKFEYTIEDRRIIPERNLSEMIFATPEGKKERAYQNVIAASMINATRGVMQAATGAGKTFVVTKMIGSIKTAPFMFFVPSKDLLDQAYGCLSDCLSVPIGRIGDGHFDIQSINVSTIQTAVKAVKSNDPKFKVADYRFDEEDDWDTDPLDNQKIQAVDKLIREAKGIYIDECVCGSTKIVTEKGIQEISEVLNSRCRRVMTYKNGRFELAKITGWWNKGVRKVVKISMSNGLYLRCTEDHLIGTNRGWICAKDLKKTDMILYASAGAELFCQKTNEKTDKEYMFSDIKSKVEPIKDGKKPIPDTYQKYHYVNVGVDKTFLQKAKVLNSLSKVAAHVDTLNISSDMINSLNGPCIISSQPNKKNKQYLEPVLETHVLCSQTEDLKTKGCKPIMDLNSLSGFNIKHQYWRDLGLLLKSKKIQGMVKCGLQCTQNVYLLSRQFLKKFIKEIKKQLPQNCLINLVILDLLGGSVMTVVTAAKIWLLQFTQKVGLLLKTKLPQNGSVIMECNAKLPFQIENQIKKDTHFFLFRLIHHLSWQQKYENTYQSVCHTSWTTVTSVVDDGEDYVYDIGVEGTHTFFGNNIFIHNCHHAASRTCQAIMEAASSAYWRYGGSVGPESYIELKGGCFESGFVGTIENAFKIASKESKTYTWKEFQVIDLAGVFSRGWSGSEFIWKNCQRILRHSGKQCLLVNAKGTNLLVTPDHSVYKAEPGDKVWITTGKNRKRKTLKFEPKMGGTSSALLAGGDVLFGDDGANFGEEKEPQINMVEFCNNHMSGSKVTVCCDVKSLDHNLLRKIANSKTIYNWKKRGGIPIESFIKIKNPPPILFLTGSKRTIRIDPKINLANWAYMLGFYLGDGWVENNSKKISFAVELDRAEFISEKMKALEGITWKVKKRIMPGKSVELKANNIFVAKLLLSIFGNIRCYSKSIPGEWILSWTREHREQLLQGLLDSDGTVCNGPGEKVSYSIHTTSEHLAKSICSLLRSLGLWGGTITTKKRSGGVVKGRQIMAKRDSYIIKWSKKRPDVKRSGVFEHFDHRSIKFTELSVKKVSKDITPEWIYDLEMSGHPSFTADGILVHNSATPFREDGAEKMIQALFGKVVTRVSASWLIRNKYLVKPFIFNVRMNTDHGYYSSYPEIYKNYIVENDDLNQLVAKLTIRMRQFNIPTLILVQQYKHGDALTKYIPDAPFIKGNMPRKKRKDSIQSMRDGTLSCAIATTLADEGLDVERLGCVAVAGGGKSITRVYQRVGRVLRTFEGKERAIVFVFTHDAKFLKDHGDKVSRMLRQEPEFVVIDTDEKRVMDDLNDLLCPGSVGIFG